ncbi:hypothetical protein KQI76_07025 [Amphibacillus sp. MSJ-3]|uniref:hypothetical protein n=1 Tax=Amphibacillus sp. MSJ-3 TaxID=2841505 RepID=UPI001C0EC5F8|nr:hypothetical protein [Amphibacillus sp. MSJ-3]MBU5594913.1 hypothetical protein [Amphibacillus sp. MSJ-3]
MRLEPIKLFSLEEIGRDELNNPIKEPVLIGLYKGAITQWTTEEIALLDREITQSQRKLLTDAPKNVIKHAERVEVEEMTYTLIDTKSDFKRWRLVHVKEFRP